MATIGATCTAPKLLMNRLFLRGPCQLWAPLSPFLHLFCRETDPNPQEKHQQSAAYIEHVPRAPALSCLIGLNRWSCPCCFLRSKGPVLTPPKLPACPHSPCPILLGQASHKTRSPCSQGEAWELLLEDYFSLLHSP